MARILFIASRPPFPPIGGDRLKNYWLLKILSKHFDVHLVSIAEEDPPEEFFKWLNSLNITYKLFRKPKAEFYLNALMNINNQLPIQVNYYFFQDVKNYINSIYKNYDLIFSTLVRTAKYAIDIDKPKILDMADSIGLNYLRSFNKSTSTFWKLIYKFEANRLLQFEKLCIDCFDKTLFFNQEERNYFEKEEKTAWIPHGVNESLLNYNKTDNQYKNWIVFFGKMNYQPNIDAALWFTKNVLPLLREDLTFGIIGAYPTKQLLELERKHPNVKVTGFIDDPYIILKSALCVVAPMQTGGGIQNKILESMALGTINIVSSLAAKPIGGINMRDFIVEDQPQKIANIINDIPYNPKRYNHIKTFSRDFIKNNFTWSIYEQNMLCIINEVLSKHQ